jgi:lipoate-protein ligase B
MNDSKRNGWIANLGLIPYAQACELQQQLVEARKAQTTPDVLLFCEHPHVITIGRNGKDEHLLADDRVLKQMNLEYLATNRGGDVTYHGPGQIVGYPILDLAEHRRDIRWYVDRLEEVMIRAAADFGIAAQRVEGQHGIWVNLVSGEEKLGALGVHLSRWVTSHGFAYNVSTDLSYFDLIIPCGIAGKRATSLEKLLNRAIPADEVRSKLSLHFAEVFDLNLVAIGRDELRQMTDSRHGSVVPANPVLA